MTSVPGTIAELEAEVMAIDARRPRLLTAIATLRALSDTHTPPDGVLASTCANAKPVTPTPAPARKASTVPKTSASRGSGSTVSDEAIIAAIQRMEPVAPRDVAKALGLDEVAFRYRSSKLIQQGKVLGSQPFTVVRRTVWIRFAQPTVAAVRALERAARILQSAHCAGSTERRER